MVDVFLYYWDHRDGASFEGWWFGNRLGGTQAGLKWLTYRICMNIMNIMNMLIISL